MGHSSSSAESTEVPEESPALKKGISFFWRKRREQFQWFRHGMLPVLSTVLMFGIFMAAAISPGPTPLSFIPYVVGTWIVLGLGTLVLIRGKIEGS